MSGKDDGKTSGNTDVMDTLKNLSMLALILIFVFLYVSVLFGWIKPLGDAAMIAHFEPIIFIIIGYYFGTLPSRQNEETLKEEIIRQTNRTAAAQNAKEKIQQEIEIFEEKIKNARLILTTVESSKDKEYAIKTAVDILGL